jgi:hypothetical protein
MNLDKVIVMRIFKVAMLSLFSILCVSIGAACTTSVEKPQYRTSWVPVPEVPLPSSTVSWPVPDRPADIVSPVVQTPDRVIGLDGTWLVGVDIAPGTYRATVPYSAVGMCYWARLSSTDGMLSSVITNGIDYAGASVIITISVKDKAFQTSGCGAWDMVK